MLEKIKLENYRFFVKGFRLSFKKLKIDLRVLVIITNLFCERGCYNVSKYLYQLRNTWEKCKLKYNF